MLRRITGRRRVAKTGPGLHVLQGVAIRPATSERSACGGANCGPSQRKTVSPTSDLCHRAAHAEHNVASITDGSADEKTTAALRCSFSGDRCLFACARRRRRDLSRSRRTSVHRRAASGRRARATRGNYSFSSRFAVTVVGTATQPITVRREGGRNSRDRNDHGSSERHGDRRVPVPRAAQPQDHGWLARYQAHELRFRDDRGQRDLRDGRRSAVRKLRRHL